MSTEAQGRQLTATLGGDRHFDLLAAIYSLRSDPALVVRNAALHIWQGSSLLFPLLSPLSFLLPLRSLLSSLLEFSV